MDSPNVFLVSDTHFHHRNILTFDGVKGGKMRPFATVEEMDEAMIENWNKVVRPHDKLYHLGDVTMGKLDVLARLNGSKVLIMGNHDQRTTEEYLVYFRKVQSVRKLGDYVLSHIPLHPASINRWAKGNVHGHLHDGRVLLPDGTIDQRYICACVEHTNYTPVALEEIEKLR